MSRIYKNWPVHNLIGHPVSELAYWAVRPFSKSTAKRIKKRRHDSTMPKKYIKVKRVKKEHGKLPRIDTESDSSSAAAHDAISRYFNR